MNKKLILLLTAILFFTVNSKTQTLVLYTTLDDAGSITSPDTGPAGTQNGGSFAVAKYDDGFLSDANNEHASFNVGSTTSTHENDKLNLDKGTIAFWYKPNSNSSSNSGANRFLGIGSYPGRFFLQIEDFGSSDIWMDLGGTNRNFGTLTYNAGDLIHIAAVWNSSGSSEINGGDTYGVYINGSLFGSHNGSFSTTTFSSSTLYIGGYTDGSGNADGIIDDFFIYDDVLTSAQINSLKDSQVLPVELSSFNAGLVNQAVELNWETATEINNYGFNIERTLDHLDWETIGFVQGHGTTNSPKNYEFTDSELPNVDEVSYRLKQIDNDGTFAYSKIVTVDLTTITSVDGEEIPIVYSLSQNYPNPFNPTTTIKFGLPESGFVELTVYNILGQKVARLVNKELTGGYHEVNFSSNNIASGIYFYKIEAGNFVDVKKMNLLK